MDASSIPHEGSEEESEGVACSITLEFKLRQNRDFF